MWSEKACTASTTTHHLASSKEPSAKLCVLPASPPNTRAVESSFLAPRRPDDLDTNVPAAPAMAATDALTGMLPTSAAVAGADAVAPLSCAVPPPSS